MAEITHGGLQDLDHEMTQAACDGDGKKTAACFTSTGVYHDVFYGSFEGAAIIEMIENYFHRDAENFIWDLHDPVDDDKVGYARYVFSYDSKLADHRGKRAVFEGVSICRLRDGLIEDYREVAGRGGRTTPARIRQRASGKAYRTRSAGTARTPGIGVSHQSLTTAIR